MSGKSIFMFPLSFQLSFQYLVLLPSITFYRWVTFYFIPQTHEGSPKANPLRSCHFFSYPVVQSSYLAPITFLHNISLLFVYFHNHFILRALLWNFKFFIPIPPLSILLTSHHCLPFYQVKTFLLNFLLMLSNFLMTLAGIGKRDIVWVGKASSTTLIRVSL